MNTSAHSLDNDNFKPPKGPVGPALSLHDLSEGLKLKVLECNDDSRTLEPYLTEVDSAVYSLNADDTTESRRQATEPEEDEDMNELLRADQINVETFMDDFILDSIAVQYHASVFWVQFISHLFYPFAYFLVNYKMQGFSVTPSNWSGINFNLLFPSIIYAMIILYYLCPAEDELPIRGAYWVPMILFIQHRMTVALKYASLSPTEYSKFQHLTDVSKANRYTAQIQILTAWATVRSDLLLQFELGCAAARIGAKINEISITIAGPNESETARNEFACWNALLRGESTVRLNARPAPELVRHADGRFTLSVYELSKAIIKKADRCTGIHGSNLIILFVLFMILLPWLKLLASDVPFQRRSSVMYAFLACNALALMIYGNIGFNILYASAVWDVSRILHIAKYLHRFIRITDLTLDATFSLRKGGNKAREREQAREKMSVLLSVTRPERRKSLAIRSSISGGKLSGWIDEAGDVDEDGVGGSGRNRSGNKNSFRDKAASTREGYSNSSRRPTVSTKELKSRFSEFGTKSVKEEDHSHIPQVSFKYPENIIAWTYARLVFQHFGERFRSRIDTYTGGTALLMLGLMGAELILVLIDPNPLAMFHTVFFMQTMVTVVLMWIFLLACCSLGALVNAQLAQHSRTFAAHKLRLRDELLVLSALQEEGHQASDALRESLEVLEDCKEVIETYAELKPFSVFGFKIEASTVFTVFSTGISFFGVLFSLYSNASSSEGGV